MPARGGERDDQGLAIFGGAFDPPHTTHCRIAVAAAQQLPVARTLVIPAGDHPHKRDRQMTAAGHRLAMARLAFAGLPSVHVDDREVRRPGPSFTVETLAELAGAHPGQRLWLVLGADNLRSLPTWHDHHRLLALASIATFPRLDAADGAPALAGLDLSPTEQTQLLRHRLQLTPDRVASADLRRRLAAGERGLHELPAGVEAYALQHHLYRT